MAGDPLRGFPRSEMEHTLGMAAARDPRLRGTLEKVGWPSRAHGRTMDDAALIAKLAELGAHVDRAWLDRQSRAHSSAEEIAASLHAGIRDGGQERNWRWVCLAVLWERWFPDRPNPEMLDDKMQQGYLRQEAPDTAGAARIWLDAWRDVLVLADRLNLRSVEAFDEWFRGTQSLSNWVHDVAMTLWNAGFKDRAFWRDRIVFCESLLDRFTIACNLNLEATRRDLAETYAALGDRDRCDALFRGWLEADPQWGWGWIGWASCYAMPAEGSEAPEVAERILRQGLAVPGVRDRTDLEEHLETLRQENSDTATADEVVQAIDVSPTQGAAKLTTKVTFGGQGLPLDQLPQALDALRTTHRRAIGAQTMPANGGMLPPVQPTPKIGRNEPCPCGSGRKYKKCCGQG